MPPEDDPRRLEVGAAYVPLDARQIHDAARSEDAREL